MNIRKFVTIINIVIVFSIIVTGAALALLLHKNLQVKEVQEKRFLSNLLVNELRGTSEELTQQVRIYAATGSATAEAAYNKVLTVRSGQDPRPKNALLAPGEKYVLLDLMKAHGITDAEFAKVNLANELSDALVVLEVEAMSAVKGLFKDATGKYTVKREPDLGLATRLVFSPEYITETAKIMAPLNEFSHMVNERTSREATSLSNQQQLLAGVVSAALCVVFISCIFNLIAMRRKVIVPLEQTTAFAGRVAAGELEASIADGGNDEMGQLRRTLNSMVSNLKARLDEVQRSSNQAAVKEHEALQAKEEADLALEQARREEERRLELAGKLQTLADVLSKAVSQLEAQIQISAGGAEEQAGQATETATAMEEMNASVFEVSRSAESAAMVSESARAKAASGAAIVDNVVKSIHSVHNNSEQLRANMRTLEEQAEGISQIMTVISDIADQTNLLALNAAIEAARAGDAGRGFAVVADEVRKLAEKTMASTHDVGQAIKSIQQSAVTSVKQAKSTAELVEQTAQLSQESGATLKEIVELVAKAAQQITAIYTASSEQAKASDGITQAVARISEISAETMQHMREASHAVEELAQQAGSMLGLVENLRE